MSVIASVRSDDRDWKLSFLTLLFLFLLSIWGVALAEQIRIEREDQVVCIGLDDGSGCIITDDSHGVILAEPIVHKFWFVIGDERIELPESQFISRIF